MSNENSSSAGGVATTGAACSDDSVAPVETSAQRSQRIREEEIKALREERESVLNGTHRGYRDAIDPYELDFRRADLNGRFGRRGSLLANLPPSSLLPQPETDTFTFFPPTRPNSDPLLRVSGQEH